MTVPPYVVGCLFTIAGGFFADRYKQRGIFMIGYCFLAMVGFAMLLSTENHYVKYVGTFLVVSGIYPNVSGGVAWNSNNIGGTTKRCVPPTPPLHSILFCS
jgi:nitrate/nitrite transporter NarK